MNQTPHIIGVSGRKRSGKDVFFQTAEEMFPGAVAKIAFADALKEEASEYVAECDWIDFGNRIYNLPFTDEVKDTILKQAQPLWDKGIGTWFSQEELLDFFNNDEVKHCFRMLLQAWGTELRRQGGTLGSYHDPLEFVRSGRRVIAKAQESYWLDAWEHKVCDLPPTAKIVVVPDVRFPNEFDFLYGRAAEMVRIERPSLESNDLHISETALDSENRWDTVLFNDGTLEQYKSKITNLLLQERSDGLMRLAA